MRRLGAHLSPQVSALFDDGLQILEVKDPARYSLVQCVAGRETAVTEFDSSFRALRKELDPHVCYHGFVGWLPGKTQGVTPDEICYYATPHALRAGPPEVVPSSQLWFDDGLVRKPED
jgi:hypothetical protein